MHSETIPPPPPTVDPAAAWLRAVARERRTFREFVKSSGDEERVGAYRLWIDAHRGMMDCPAPNETALGQKIRALLAIADMQLGEGAEGLSAICADLWRMADLEQRPSNAVDWLDAFECYGGRWSIDAGGISYFVRLEGCTDADVMMARRLKAQLDAKPGLEAEVRKIILEGDAGEEAN